MSPAAPQAQWAALVEAASRPYLQAGRFAWGFARGKLGRDPVFRHLLSHGLIAPGARVLDIGCGRGLLASLLRAGAEASAQGRWPRDWAPAPVGVRVTGIDFMPSDLRLARTALGGDSGEGGVAEFICGDMRDTAFPRVDTVVMLDVLHYISEPEQNAVLARVREALPAGGRVVMRVGDAASGRGFRFSRWVDAVVALARNRRVTPLAGRPLAQWVAQLESLGFSVRGSQPMSAGTLFANVLLVAHLNDTQT